MPSLAEQLRDTELFGGLPDERLAWLAARGEVSTWPAGTVLARQGDPPDAFSLILDGEVRWTKRVGGREVHAVTLGPGEVFAELILILGAPYPTTGTTTEVTSLLRFPPDAFWEILGTCDGVLRSVVRIAVQRAEIHETVAQQEARLIGLGQVAAGLAHELGNPTAALTRAAAALDEAVTALAGHEAAAPDGGVLDPLERADREEELRARLTAAGRPDAGELAASLAASGAEIPEDGDVVRLASRVHRHGLAGEIRTAAGRIAALVDATKAVTAMDRAPDAEPVDVVAVLRAAVGILEPGRVELLVQAPVPAVQGSAGDLGQLVLELLRNAMQAGSQVSVGVASGRAGWVEIAVDDDGPGVPADRAERIFEPFYSTRGAAGAGLGLHRARRIAEQHLGELVHAGGARFVVRLPAVPARDAGVQGGGAVSPVA